MTHKYLLKKNITNIERKCPAKFTLQHGLSYNCSGFSQWLLLLTHCNKILCWYMYLLASLWDLRGQGLYLMYLSKPPGPNTVMGVRWMHIKIITWVSALELLKNSPLYPSNPTQMLFVQKKVLPPSKVNHSLLCAVLNLTHTSVISFI